MVSEEKLLTYLKHHFRYENGSLIRLKATTRWKAGTTVGNYVSKRGYKTLTVLGKRHPTHRLIFLLCNGYLPKLVDHINRVKTDNRIENLRDLNKSENSLNMVSAHKDNKLGVLGVFKRFDTGKYVAQFRGFRLGEFDTLEEAKQSYDEIKSRTIKIPS